MSSKMAIFRNVSTTNMVVVVSVILLLFS